MYIIYSIIFIIIFYDVTISILYNYLRKNFDLPEPINLFFDELYRSINKNNNLRLKTFTPSEPQKISEVSVEDIDKINLTKLTQNFTKPLVIRGFSKNTDSAEKWDLQYFSTNFGYLKVPVVLDADIEKDHPHFVQIHETTHTNITIAECIRNIKELRSYYLNNICQLFGETPDFLKEINLKYIQKKLRLNEKSITHLFIGAKNTGLSLHASICGTLYFNVKGKTNWTLIDPYFSKLLKPNVSKSGLFAVSHLDILNAKKGDLLLNVPRYQANLEESDLLIIPPWWWNAVKNETNVIGCGNRYSNFYSAIKNNPLFSFIFCSHPFYNIQNLNKTNQELDEFLVEQLKKI